MPVQIHQWTDIAEHYNDGLLLGNGASIAVDPRFSYASLFQAASEAGFLTESVRQVFERFDNSTDFEYVLRKLWQAKQVNQALEIESEAVDDAYQEVRTALIETVRATHLTHAEAMPNLELIYQFMRRFKTVLSLNYDLIVYWASLLGNDALRGEHRFKDCLVNGALDDDWARLRNPLRANQTVTLFFYPHGNLVLARNPNDIELKITADGGRLLDEIIAGWENGRYVPMFVSEGASQQKREAIGASNYLSEVYFNVITDVGASLTIYGWRLGEQEAHILHQLKRRVPRRVAVSLYPPCPNHQRDAVLIEEQLRLIGVEQVEFFDSQSACCWNNPA